MRHLGPIGRICGRYLEPNTPLSRAQNTENSRPNAFTGFDVTGAVGMEAGFDESFERLGPPGVGKAKAFGVSPDQVKLYVGYLRRKLDPDAPERAPIETVRGFGYRYRRTSD